MIFNSEINSSEFVKKAFTVLLREAFKLTDMPEEYRYSEDELVSKIWIYITNPIRAEKFPLLVISTGPVDYSVKHFDDELIEETRDSNGHITEIKRVMPIMTPVTVKINALTTQDRDKLTDITSFLIRRVFRDKFAQEGIAYTGINISADAEESWFNQVVYTKEITVKCYTEIVDTIPQSLITSISNVVLADIVILEP